MKILSDIQQLSEKTAQLFVELAEKCIASRGFFFVALSGGSTPKHFFEMLSKTHGDQKCDWKKIFLFWGDERYVPLWDSESNYRMTKEALLDSIAIPESNIFAIPFAATAEESARYYEKTLRKNFATLPRFDLVLLGLGQDGHTASLFPDNAVLYERERWVATARPAQGGAERITLTYPVINNARNIWFLVAGKEKASVVEAIWRDDDASSKYPASAIQPVNGEMLWLIDEAAASNLNIPRTNRSRNRDESLTIAS